MKRMVKFILCAALFLPLSACGSAQDQSAIDALVDASIEMQNMQNAHLDLEIGIGSEKETMPFKAKITSQSEFALTEEDIQVKANLSATVDGTPLMDDLNFYLKDSCFYFDSAEAKGKMTLPINLSAFMSLMGTNKVDKAQMKEQYLELYPEIKWEDKSKGIIALTYDETKLQDEMNKANTNDLAITMKDIKGTYIIQNNQIQQMGLNLKLVIEGEELDCDLIIGLSNINRSDEISFPDFSDYVEIETDDDAFGIDGSNIYDQNPLSDDDLNNLFGSEDF